MANPSRKRCSCSFSRSYSSPCAGGGCWWDGDGGQQANGHDDSNGDQERGRRWEGRGCQGAVPCPMPHDSPLRWATARLDLAAAHVQFAVSPPPRRRRALSRRPCRSHGPFAGACACGRRYLAAARPFVGPLLLSKAKRRRPREIAAPIGTSAGERQRNDVSGRHPHRSEHVRPLLAAVVDSLDAPPICPSNLSISQKQSTSSATRSRRLLYLVVGT